MQTWQTSPKCKTKRRAAIAGNSSLADWCLKTVDIGLAGIIFVAPLFLGGRHLFGRMIFIGLACLVGVAWLTRQALLCNRKWTPTFAHAIGLGAIALVAIQLIPMPTEWIAWLSPRNQSLLPLWNTAGADSVSLGSWGTLSLVPQDTKLALATLIAYYLLFITTIQRLQTLEDIEYLVKAIALAALLMSGFGLIQYLTSNGRFLWFYELPYSDTHFPVKGSFSCRNHFAHFLVLGIGPLFAWIHLSRSHKQDGSSWSSRNPTRNSGKTALYAGCVLLAVAVLTTLSRGGAMAATIAMVVVLVYYLRNRIISTSNFYGLAMLSLLVIGVLSLGNYDKVAGRLDDFTTGSVEDLDSHDARRRVWHANLSAIKRGGLFGAGAGSHREIYPVYLSESFRKEYTHAENSYLQIVTENGWLGLGLLCGVVLCVIQWCWRAARTAMHKKQLILTGAIIASLTASLVHSMVDFVWYIPACLSLTLLLVACALRLAQLGTSEQNNHYVREKFWNRPRWIALATVASLAAFYAITTAIQPARASLMWDKFLLASIESKHLSSLQLKNLKTETEQSDMQHALNELMIMQLRTVVTYNPQFARAHLRLAARYLQLFESHQRNAENAMPVEQIRAAATSSKFASSEVLRAWLTQAFGENSNNLYRAYFHARQALLISPMQAEAYLYLSKLCFLAGRDQHAVEAYVQQSLLIRPQSGKVLLESGWQYLQLGEIDRAIEYWQAVYRQPEPRRLQIVQRLAGVIPSAHFIQLFQPDWHTLPYVWKRYRQLGTSEDWQVLLDHGRKMAKLEESEHSHFGAGRIWLKLSKMQNETENRSGVLGSLSRAYQLAPDDYSVRRALGRTLLQEGQPEQAQTHLRWCLARKPDDARLRGELVKATKENYHSQAAKTQASASHLK